MALAPVRRRRIDQIAIVDGTLIPTRDHRLAARSKNHRYSTTLQVAIDADTRLVIATGNPKPGNRNDCAVYRDSGIAATLTDWQEERNSLHRGVRARVEHALARMKCWKALRGYRRAGRTLRHAVSGIAHLHNLALSG